METPSGRVLDALVADEEPTALIHFVIERACSWVIRLHLCVLLVCDDMYWHVLAVVFFVFFWRLEGVWREKIRVPTKLKTRYTRGGIPVYIISVSLVCTYSALR